MYQKKIKKCQEWFCSSAAEPLCRQVRMGEISTEEDCFYYYCQEHCRQKNKGCPNHPQPKPVIIPQWNYSPAEITLMSKTKLKNALRKDFQLIQELRNEIESDLAALDVAEESEWWDPDLTGDLLTTLVKIQTVITVPNGLNDKLEQWNNFGEEEVELDDF